MQRIFIALLTFISFVVSAQNVTVDQVKDPVAWVNPLMGTDSKPSLSNGNVYPAIAFLGYELLDTTDW